MTSIRHKELCWIIICSGALSNVKSTADTHDLYASLNPYLGSLVWLCNLQWKQRDLHKAMISSICPQTDLPLPNRPCNFFRLRKFESLSSNNLQEHLMWRHLCMAEFLPLKKIFISTRTENFQTLFIAI